MKRLIIALVVAVGVLVAVDYGAAALAESTVSRQVRDQLGLAEDPAVRINGFPFLTQAISGTYRSVEVSADRIQVGDLRNVGIRAKLTDVEAPLSSLTGSGQHTLVVAEAEGAARVPASDIERLLPGVDKLGIGNVDANAISNAVEEDGDPTMRSLDPENVARLTGSVTFLGQKYDIAVLAELQVSDGTIRVVPRDVRLGDSDPLPGPVVAMIRQLFTLTLDPGALPFGVVPTEARPRDGTLEILGEATDLRIGGTPSSAGS